MKSMLVGALASLSVQSDRNLASALGAAKAFQAGVIRTYLYQKLDTQPPAFGVSVEDMTNGIVNVINRFAKEASGIDETLVLPLLDSSGVYLANLDSNGKTMDNMLMARCNDLLLKSSFLCCMPVDWPPCHHRQLLPHT